MGEKTVKKRIFISNALMVIVTLAIFLAVNMVIIRVYTDSVERQFRMLPRRMDDDDWAEHLLEDLVMEKDEFALLFLADGILCIAVLFLVSQVFTKNLTNHILEPLTRLEEGAERIRSNDLSEDISYSGEVEFERVCTTFNAMQRHILEEQEKNRRYEKARTDMIAGISHDLRTPLTAIRGTIKGLLDGVASTPETQQKFLETAYRRTGDMTVLLNQLFYLSRLETGNMPISLQDVKIGDFVENYVRAKQDFLEKDREELLLENTAEGAVVSVDPEQLVRVFDNLLENSRKYGEMEHLEMKITLTQGEKNVCLIFQDNGIGVPQEKMPHVFEEFYRGDESRNRKEGNGLGLYIVRYLMEAMGGKVWAESRDGFIVYMVLPKLEGKETGDGGQTDTDRGR